MTDLPKTDFQEYYNGYANRVLWPILHYRLDLAEFSRRDLGGYLRVNELKHCTMECAGCVWNLSNGFCSSMKHFLLLGNGL